MNKVKIIILILGIFYVWNIYPSDLLIRRVSFEGNVSITNRELQNIILSRENTTLNRSIVNDDAQRINNYYQQRGFTFFIINTPIITPVSSRYVDVIFIIEEFSEPIIDKILFNGNSYFSESKIFELIGNNPDDSYNLTSLDLLLRQVTELYLSRGFLFVKVQLRDISLNNNNEQLHENQIIGSLDDFGINNSNENDSHFIANIDIIEGYIVRAENFVFRGNDVTRENILIVESRIQQGQIVTPDVINLAERRISSKPYINSCHILPVNENTLLINITEGRMTHLSAVMGYSSSEERGNNFNGFINGDLLNLMGTDRNLSFAWRGFEGIFTSFLIDYHESGPLNIPIAGDLSLYREERDSTSVRTEIGIDVYFSYRTQKYGILGGLNELFPGSRRPRLIERQTDRLVGFFWEGDFTDDIINPRNGWNMRYSQQYIFVNRESERLQRHRFESKISVFYPLNRSFVLANSLTGIYLENNSLTAIDLIRLGGAYSIRGFYEDFYMGNLVFYSNSELRFLMSRYSRVFLFLDYGYLEDNRYDINNKFYDLIGIGFGLRAESRIGLLRIDYGFHHANGKWLNPLNGLIHFGIETSF